MVTFDRLVLTSRDLRWLIQCIILGLTAVVHTACNANPIHQKSAIENPARLTIKFEDVRREPPEEIQIELSGESTITIYREQPLSGGAYRYLVPETDSQRISDIVGRLSDRPDIRYIELDRRRRID